MKDISLDSYLQNENLDNFIEFINKFEVSYAFYGITHDCDLSYPNKNEIDIVKCIVKINNYNYSQYSSQIYSMFNNIYIEITINMKKLKYEYYSSMKYLSEIGTNLSKMKNEFDYLCLAYEFNFDSFENNFINLTPLPKFNHRKKYNYMIETNITEFIIKTNDYINKIFDLMNHSLLLISDDNCYKKFQKNILQHKENLLRLGNIDSFIFNGVISDNFNSFHDSLCKNKFIYREKTNIMVFRCAFKGDIIKNKIIWHGGIPSLRYLIRSLRKKGLISYPKNSQLNLVRNCFTLPDDSEIKKITFNSNLIIIEQSKRLLDEAIEFLVKEKKKKDLEQENENKYKTVLRKLAS